jgi:hypothetical protein
MLFVPTQLGLGERKTLFYTSAEFIPPDRPLVSRPQGKDAVMPRRMTLALLVLTTMLSAGCANGRFYNPFRSGNAQAPNDVQAQRIRATVHDPYPDQDKGPAVDDARPRDYQRQTPQPVRNRFSADNPWGG